MFARQVGYLEKCDGICLGDGGGGQGEGGNSGKIFFLQLLCKIRTFCYFFIHIFRAKMSCPLTLTELLRLCVMALDRLPVRTIITLLNKKTRVSACFVFTVQISVV